jgi:hypothetical protein
VEEKAFSLKLPTVSTAFCLLKAWTPPRAIWSRWFRIFGPGREGILVSASGDAILVCSRAPRADCLPRTVGVAQGQSAGLWLRMLGVRIPSPTPFSSRRTSRASVKDVYGLARVVHGQLLGKSTLPFLSKRLDNVSGPPSVVLRRVPGMHILVQRG